MVRINTVLLGITFPRIPCNTLGTRMSDADFVKHFIQARRPGVYTRVLETGEIQVGVHVVSPEENKVEILPTSDNFPTVVELYDLWHAQKRDTNLLTQALKGAYCRKSKKSI